MTKSVPASTKALVRDLDRSNDHIEVICELVAEVLDCETVIVSLLDDVKQWFRFHSGIICDDATDVDVAFCAHTIREDRVFEVGDARFDGRFTNNPLVIGEPHIVYYAGYPLILEDGTRPGALAIIDDAPRPALTAKQKKIMRQFATLISRELDLTLR
jgi:GAF domain-containing protein